MTLRVVVSSAKRNMYVPAGSVTPGSATGWLNVKYVRLSDVNALAPLAAPTSTTNTEVVISLFNMLASCPYEWQDACPFQRERDQPSDEERLTSIRSRSSRSSRQRAPAHVNETCTGQRSVRSKADTTSLATRPAARRHPRSLVRSHFIGT